MEEGVGIREPDWNASVEVGTKDDDWTTDRDRVKERESEGPIGVVPG